MQKTKQKKSPPKKIKTCFYFKEKDCCCRKINTCEFTDVCQCIPLRAVKPLTNATGLKVRCMGLSANSYGLLVKVHREKLCCKSLYAENTSKVNANKEKKIISMSCITTTNI